MFFRSTNYIAQISGRSVCDSITPRPEWRPMSKPALQGLKKLSQRHEGRYQKLRKFGDMQWGHLAHSIATELENLNYSLNQNYELASKSLTLLVTHLFTKCKVYVHKLK